METCWSYICAAASVVFVDHILAPFLVSSEDRRVSILSAKDAYERARNSWRCGWDFVRRAEDYERRVKGAEKRALDAEKRARDAEEEAGKLRDERDAFLETRKRLNWERKKVMAENLREELDAYLEVMAESLREELDALLETLPGNEKSGG